MKKFLALLLALVMVFALAACGEEPAPETEAPGTEAPSEGTETPETPEEPEAIDPNDVPDTMESDTYEIAFITDVGDLKDKSFNEGTWNGVKAYAYENDISYKYYQPANGGEATDDDRYDSMKQAVDNGASIVVCVGFLQEAAIRKAAAEFPDVHFVFIDGTAVRVSSDPDDGSTEVFANTLGINFREEQCGYLAGYAVVKDGFTQLGFAGGGGGTNPACCRYGYGFLQGASAAAEELGVDVTCNYSWQYGGNFQPSPELQNMIAGWYNNGTEVVFSCGGNMFASVSAAASAAGQWVVGVDVDQASASDTVVTSAMKDLAGGSVAALEEHFNGTWDDVGGTTITLGANEDAVGLPTAEDSWRFESFTVEDYNALMDQIKDGTLVVESEYPVDDTNMDDADSLNGELPNITINVV